MKSLRPEVAGHTSPRPTPLTCQCRARSAPTGRADRREQAVAMSTGPVLRPASPEGGVLKSQHGLPYCGLQH
jgi:nucleoid-associated protein YgaU